VEYYIVESYGTHNPSNTSEAIFKGNVTSDGEVYTIFTKTRTDAPSIIGTATFKQYWSVRNTLRTGGTVTTGNHYTAWEAAGLPLGKFSDMIVAVEGQNSTGTASITVGVAPAGA
jgi:endo-1,4-beta-xylanase